MLLDHKNLIRLFTFFLLFSAFECSTSQHFAYLQTQKDKLTICYNQLINGYAVTVQWLPDSFLKSCYGDAVYTLVKKNDTIVFRHRLCIDDVGVIPDYEHCMGKTITLDYKEPSSDAPFTGNVLLNFADVNYDGKMELITYGYLSLSAHEGEKGNLLDCYPIYVWQIQGHSVSQFSGEPFDELAEGPCRANVYFQHNEQALILDRYYSYGEGKKTVYYFKKGILSRVSDSHYQYDHEKEKQIIISHKERHISE